MPSDACHIVEYAYYKSRDTSQDCQYWAYNIGFVGEQQGRP